MEVRVLSSASRLALLKAAHQGKSTPAGSHRRACSRCSVQSVAYSPVSRRLRCITMIEPPAHTRSSPAPTVQRRSKPVNGNLLAFAGFVADGVLLAVAGETVLAGVVEAGVFVDFEGEVPLLGVGAFGSGLL